jgi:uncharacterized protein (TIGR02145 family)
LGTSNTAWNVSNVGTNKFFVGSISWRETNTINDNPYATAANNPCPTGWVVPSQTQWSSLFLGGVTSGGYNATGTFNKWEHAGTGSSYALQPDGATTTLFLPASGLRNTTVGANAMVGSIGFYWSSLPHISVATSAINLDMNYNELYPGGASFTYRGYGCSVRCVASQN